MDISTIIPSLLTITIPEHVEGVTIERFDVLRVSEHLNAKEVLWCLDDAGADRPVSYIAASGRIAIFCPYRS